MSEEGYLFIYELIVPDNQPCSEIQLEVLKLDALENVPRHVPDEHNQESDSGQNTGLLHNEMESEYQQTSQKYEPKLCHVCKDCQMQFEDKGLLHHLKSGQCCAVYSNEELCQIKIYFNWTSDTEECSDIEQDSPSYVIELCQICKNCRQQFENDGLLHHLKNKQCCSVYSEDELNAICKIGYANMAYTIPHTDALGTSMLTK